MRNKIIAVNAVIVLLVGLLAFAIVKTQLSLVTSNTDQLKRSAQTDAVSVASRLQLDGLRAERWLSTKAAEAATKGAIGRSTPDARADAARQLSDQLANAAPTALGVKPSIVALVDPAGKLVGRNGSDIGRGDDIAASYPAFKDALGKTAPGSDIWVDTKRSDQYIASYVPVRDDNGRTWMLVIGLALNDALTRATQGMSSRGVLLVKENGDPLANTQTSDDVKKAVKDGAADVKNALTTGNVVGGGAGDHLFAAAPLDQFGEKKTAVVAVAPTSLLDTSAVPYSILGAMALGLILVVGGGWFLGGYISRPIAMLEEGLLAILNGQSDKRFELDHAELGGLAFRIDQLLNQLMGVEEDNTDEEGRVSKAPQTIGSAQGAYGVDPSFMGIAPSSAPLPGGEPAEQYYQRIYGEYINAKRGLGEQVDHITLDVFKGKIQSMEQDALSKHGKPVRYAVQVAGREVQLVAVAV